MQLMMRTQGIHKQYHVKAGAMHLQAVTHSRPTHPAVPPFEGKGSQGCTSAPVLQKLELQVVLGPSTKQGINEPPNVVHKLHAHERVIGVACIAVICFVRQ